MKVFDELIQQTLSLLPQEQKSFTEFRDTADLIGGKNEIILGKESLYELGGSSLNCAVYNLYTIDEALVSKDEVILCGKDIGEIKEDCSFAKIAIIRTDIKEEQDEQSAYDILEKINLKKYDVFPKGYMVRTSVLSNREQARVSKVALKNKLSFRDVGKMYIDQFHKNPHVKAVKIIFVTTEDADYLELDRLGMKATNLFRAMNHAIYDLKMDCSHCEWKVLCDEFEGMKEMHQKILNEKE